MKTHLGLLVVVLLTHLCIAGNEASDDLISRAQARSHQLERAQVLLKNCSPSNATNHLAEIGEAEKICDSLLWAADGSTLGISPYVIILKARLLFLGDKTIEARKLLEDEQASLSAATSAALERGVPKDKTPQFEADLLKAEISRHEAIHMPSDTNGNK